MEKRTLLAAAIATATLWFLVPISRAQHCDLVPMGFPQDEHREYRGPYKNKSYGYSVEIPVGLVGYDDANPFYQHGFGILLGAQPQSYLFVNGEPNTLEFRTPRDAAARRLGYLNKNGNRIESSRITESHLGQLKAALLSARFTCSGQTERYFVWSILAIGPDRSQLYEVSLYALEAHFEQDKAVLDAIVKSWKHLPHEPVPENLLK